MPAAAPVRKLSVNGVLPLLAAIAILPSVLMFCGSHVFNSKNIHPKSTTESSIMLFTDQPNQIGLRSQLDLEQVATSAPYLSTNLVREQAELNTKSVAQSIEPELSANYDPSVPSGEITSFDGGDRFSYFVSVVILGTLVTLNFGFLGLSCSRWH